MSDNFSRFAMGLQILLNTAQRQAFHVLGLAALHEDKKFTANLSSLTSGISSRLLYSGVVTYPILQVRKFLEEKNAPKFQINFAAAAINTAIGVPLELNSSIKTFNALGLDIKKGDLVKMSAASFVPFMVRNAIVWSQINEEYPNLLAKSATAAVAGVVSTPFHNIGLKVAEDSVVHQSWNELGNKLLKDVKERPNFLWKGIPQRVLATAAATFLLSSEATKLIEEAAKNVINYKETPSSAPLNGSFEQVKKVSSKEAEK